MTTTVNTGLSALVQQQQAAAAKAAATTSSGSGSSSSSLSSLSGNFNSFLTLLTTQLQHQDPTQPVDSTQFTQQLVEFAGVQQQSQSNTYLQQILAASQSNQLSSASSLVGTTVQASSNNVTLSSGSAVVGYTLASAASNAQITIKDSSGAVVYTGNGTGNSGNNTLAWNGQNSTTGAQEPDGTYTISVTATGSNGVSIAATPTISGTVSSASVANGAVVLNLSNGVQVPESSVISVI